MSKRTQLLRKRLTQNPAQPCLLGPRANTGKALAFNVHIVDGEKRYTAKLWSTMQVSDRKRSVMQDALGRM